ncbi:hypothetical protein [Rhizobium sp. CCGE 510]|uniref:hypothetical protein n=1 Tax=Rhizobium sp. CCGE 510 TaxID=1132836 RepID=UPI0002F9EA93|nr:hypothetical protein [Rhizobium sp. CCGE 510]
MSIPSDAADDAILLSIGAGASRKRHGQFQSFEKHRLEWRDRVSTSIAETAAVC